MPKNESSAIRTIKREAKLSARTSSLTYCQILDERARTAGYSKWKDLLNANPSMIQPLPSGSAWSAIIVFATPTDHALWARENGGSDEFEKLAGDIVDWLDYCNPTLISWDDALTLRLGAVHQAHALAILGTLPISHIIDLGGTLYLEQAGKRTDVPYRSEAIQSDQKDGAVPLYANENRDVEWEASNGLANTLWDLLQLLCNDSMSDAMWFSEVVDEASNDRRPGQTAVITVRATSPKIIARLFDHQPTMLEIEQSIGHESGWSIDYTESGWTGGNDVTAYVTDDELILHIPGIDFDLVMRSTTKSMEDSSPKTVFTNLWWNKLQGVRSHIPTVLLGDECIFMPPWRPHPSDWHIHDMLGSFRSLGEIAIPVDAHAWPVPPNRDRCLALIGDMSQ